MQEIADILHIPATSPPLTQNMIVFPSFPLLCETHEPLLHHKTMKASNNMHVFANIGKLHIQNRGLFCPQAPDLGEQWAYHTPMKSLESMGGV